MKQIRRGVFETNSSSTHSFSVASTELEPSELYVNDDGYVEIELYEFSDGDFYSQESRLSFCLLQLIRDLDIYLPWCFYAEDTNKWTENVQTLYCNEKFKDFSDEIAAYVGNGCKGIRIREYSSGYAADTDYENLEELLLCAGTTLIEFVFGKNVSIYFEYNG